MKSDLNRRSPQLATCNVQPATFNFQPATQFSLCNTCGFWELIFDGQFAVPTQNQALFYVAWLLGHRRAKPIHGHDLATKVYDLFSEHPDFRPEMPWIGQHRDDAHVARALLNKQKTLEAILDSEDELEPVKIEALRELMFVQDMQKACFAEIANMAESTANIVFNGLLHLHKTLTRALDGHGDPHPVLRPFAHHLLVCILIPSIRASAQDHTTRFVYQPPAGVTWERWDGAR